MNRFYSCRMFKCGETKNNVQNIRFIDFQVARYSNPVLDLMYFIFTCTTRELRGQNYNIYLKTYHDSLCDLISRFKKTPTELVCVKFTNKEMILFMNSMF